MPGKPSGDAPSIAPGGGSVPERHKFLVGRPVPCARSVPTSTTSGLFSAERTRSGENGPRNRRRTRFVRESFPLVPECCDPAGPTWSDRQDFVYPPGGRPPKRPVPIRGRMVDVPKPTPQAGRRVLCRFSRRSPTSWRTGSGTRPGARFVPSPFRLRPEVNMPGPAGSKGGQGPGTRRIRECGQAAESFRRHTDAAVWWRRAGRHTICGENGPGMTSGQRFVPVAFQFRTLVNDRRARRSAMDAIQLLRESPLVRPQSPETEQSR